MEMIEGKKTRVLDAADLGRRLAGYTTVLVDLGTGDGKFVLHAARKDPALFVIGVDACRENLRDSSRSAPENALFVIAGAENLPSELNGLASRVTIHFPWGSLRDGLLQADPALLDGIRRIMRPGAALEVHLNASALAEAGLDLAAGGEQVRNALHGSGFRPRTPRLLTTRELRAVPTSWARRLASSRPKGECVALVIQTR